jgi:hypothetical protein
VFFTETHFFALQLRDAGIVIPEKIIHNIALQLRDAGILTLVEKK